MAGLNRHIVIVKKIACGCQVFCCLAEQLFLPFYSEDFCSKIEQHGRLVAAACAYLQDAVSGFYFQKICLKGNCGRLGYGLAGTYGYRCIFVCLVLQPVLHKKMTRDSADSLQSPV